MRIHILLFDDFETLDIFGPVEILARVEAHELVYESLGGGIVRSAQGTQIVTSRLAKAGALDGFKATSNKKALEWVMSVSDQVDWIRHARWVRDGKFYTSSGVPSVYPEIRR